MSAIIAAIFDIPFNYWIEQCAVVSSRFPDEMLKVSQQWHFYWINSKGWVDGISDRRRLFLAKIYFPFFFLCDQKPISFVLYLVKDTYLYSLQIEEDENTLLLVIFCICCNISMQNYAFDQPWNWFLLFRIKRTGRLELVL